MSTGDGVCASCGHPSHLLGCGMYGCWCHNGPSSVASDAAPSSGTPHDELPEERRPNVELTIRVRHGSSGLVDALLSAALNHERGRWIKASFSTEEGKSSGEFFSPRPVSVPGDPQERERLAKWNEREADNYQKVLNSLGPFAVLEEAVRNHRLTARLLRSASPTEKGQ